jgi:uncharacterized membrane protein YcaP (DUF421 family)
LETGGNLSVFLFSRERPATAGEAGIPGEEPELPFTLISDGRLLEDNLRKSGKDRRWLQKTLTQQKATQAETFLASINWIAVALFAVLLFALHYKPLKKLHPIVFIAIGAVVGVILGM